MKLVCVRDGADLKEIAEYEKDFSFKNTIIKA